MEKSELSVLNPVHAVKVVRDACKGIDVLKGSLEESDVVLRKTNIRAMLLAISILFLEAVVVGQGIGYLVRRALDDSLENQSPTSKVSPTPTAVLNYQPDDVIPLSVPTDMNTAEFSAFQNLVSSGQRNFANAAWLTKTNRDLLLTTGPFWGDTMDNWINGMNNGTPTDTAARNAAIALRDFFDHHVWPILQERNGEPGHAELTATQDVASTTLEDNEFGESPRHYWFRTHHVPYFDTETKILYMNLPSSADRQKSAIHLDILVALNDAAAITKGMPLPLNDSTPVDIRGSPTIFDVLYGDGTQWKPATSPELIFAELVLRAKKAH